MQPSTPIALPRRTTGIPNLDLVLGGGLLQNGLTMVLGAPGSGKTVITQQVASHLAQQGQRTAFFTTLSESTDQFVAQMRTFTFFDEQTLGNTLQVLSIQALAAEGFSHLSDSLVRMVRDQHLDAVIIDGFRNILGVVPAESESRQFLYDLRTKLTLLHVTLLISSETELAAPNEYVALTLADCIIGLHNQRLGLRHHRYLEVLKLRGGSHLTGLHTMDINEHGITVYPRLESLPLPPQQPIEDGLAGFGMPELDAMLGGGLHRGTTTLMIGTPGTGKTLLGLYFLMEGIRRNEPCMLLSLNETQREIYTEAHAFGLDLEQAVASGLLHMQVIDSVEIAIDEVAQILQQHVVSAGVKRLFIDGIGVLERAAERKERQPEFLDALAMLLRRLGVSSYFTLELRLLVGPMLDFSSLNLGILADNLILLRQVEYRGSLERVIAIIKMRQLGFDTQIRSFIIQPDRISIQRPLKQAGPVLTGAAQMEPEL